MPILKLTQEQKQAAEIISNWKSPQMFWLGMMLVWVFAPFSLLLLLAPVPQTGILIIGSVIGIVAGTIWYIRSLSNRYIRRLTPEQIVALKSLAEFDPVVTETARQDAALLLSEHRRIHSMPETELLRASKPTDDNTLLRPTIGNSETPKEELLRAASGQREESR